jgi:hypothetical protein
MNILDLTEQDITNAYYDQKTKKYSIKDIAKICAEASLEDFRIVLSRFQNAHTFVELVNLLVNNQPDNQSKRFSRVNTTLVRGTEHVYDWVHVTRQRSEIPY